MGENEASRSIEEVSLSDLSAPGRLAVRKELRRLETLLDADETVVSMARGAYKGRFGLVAVTKKRVIFVDRARIQSQTASFSLGRVRKIETGVTPMGYGSIELYLASDDLPPSEADVPSRLRFKVVPKSKTHDLASALSQRHGERKVGDEEVEVADVGMVQDESIEAGLDLLSSPPTPSSGDSPPAESGGGTPARSPGELP